MTDITKKEVELTNDDNKILKEFRYMLIELLKFSLVVLTSKNNNNNNTEKYKNIEHFIKICSNKKLEETPRYIEKYLNNLVLHFFNKNKGDILSGIEDLSWLNSKTLIIHYGENLPEEKINSIAMINISEIYKDTLFVSNMVKTNLISEEQGYEVNYPIIFIYKLYQVLYKLKNITNRNRETILTILIDIENLGILTETPYKDSKKSFNISNNGGLNKIMSLAMNIASSMGINGDEGELMKAFDKIDQNPELLTAMDKLGGAANNIITGLQNGNDMIKTISENVLDIIPKDESGESIREQLTSMTEMARNLDTDRIKEMINSEKNEDKLEALRDVINSIESKKE